MAKNILMVNSSYGANGFHLDFSDPDDLGADRSGNGNDFDNNGFNTNPVGIFSNDVYSFPGSQSILDSGITDTQLNSTDKDFAYPASTGFDGNPAPISIQM